MIRTSSLERQSALHTVGHMQKQPSLTGFCESFAPTSVWPAIESYCGLYVLHFANGDAYAGLSVDFRRRYLDHRETWPDIVAISFRVVDREALRREERRLIRELEKQGVPLRNSSLTTIVRGHSPLDDLVPPSRQKAWLRNQSNEIGELRRPADPAAIRRNGRALARFRRLPAQE